MMGQTILLQSGQLLPFCLHGMLLCWYEQLMVSLGLSIPRCCSHIQDCKKLMCWTGCHAESNSSSLFNEFEDDIVDKNNDDERDE